MIRTATPADIDVLANMGARFFEASPFSSVLPFDREQLMLGLNTLIGLPHARIFVAEVDGVVVGGLVGMLAPVWFNPTAMSAVEMAWWMDATHRHGSAGARLLFAFEAWATEVGARMIVMSDLSMSEGDRIDLMLARRGYRVVERAHVKGTA